MKRIWVWFVILALVLFSAAPVWADRGTGRGGDGEDHSGQQERRGGPDDSADDNGSGNANDDDGDDDTSDDNGGDDADDDGSDDQGQRDRQQDREQDRDQDRQEDRQQDRQQDRAGARSQTRFDLEGTIMGVDRTNGRVTVLVRDLSTPAGSSGQQVSVQAQAGTLLQKRAGSIWVQANMSDLQPGQTILTRGTISGDAWMASRIRVGKRL